MSSKMSWQDLFSHNTPPYAEYGKVFNSNGASELQKLRWTDTQIENYVADFYLKEYGFHKTVSPFVLSDSGNFGSVTAALKDITEIRSLSGYLFAQIQQRREGEFCNSENPRLDRRFIQARFVYLTKDVISSVYRKRLGLYQSLLYESQNNYNKKSRVERWKLDDYQASGEKSSVNWKINLAPIGGIKEYNEFIEGVVKALINTSRPAGNTEKFSRIPSPIIVVKPNLTIEEKLRIVDAVQYYVYPLMGVVTFALDYVTDNNVTLKFYDYSEEAENKFAEEELRKINVVGDFADYYATVHQLDPEIFYDTRFQDFLRKDDTAIQASNKIILNTRPFKSFRFEDWISRLMTIIDDAESTPDDIESVYYNLHVDEIVQIIQNNKTPEKVILSLLKYVQKAESCNLFRYLMFHLAIPMNKRFDIDFENQVVDLLKKMIGRVPSSALDEIPQENLVPIYSELVLCARNVGFSSSQGDGQTVMSSLLQRPGPELFKVIKTICSKESSSLIFDIVTSLKSASLNWRADQIYTFWELFELKIFEIYVALLQMLIFPDKNLEELVNSPGLFRKYLSYGRGELLSASNNLRVVKNNVAQQSLYLDLSDATLLAKIDTEVSKKLRSVCLKVAAGQKLDNILFGEWWLFAEVGYTDFGAIRDDYFYLQKMHAHIGPEIEKSITFEYRCLVGYKKTKAALSLKNICRNCNGDTAKLLNSINLRMFYSVVDVWVDENVPLHSDDLAFLIQQLPLSNKLLAKIAKSKKQIQSIASLDSTSALLWLTGTSGNIRFEYYQGQDDVLYQCLSNLKRPDSALAWRILVEENSAFSSEITWNEFVNKCQLWETRMRDGGIEISEHLGMFFRLTFQFPANLGPIISNQKLIKEFVVYILNGDLPTVTDFTSQELINLYHCGGYDDDISAYPKRFFPAGDFLINYFSRVEFPLYWEKLDSKAKTLLGTFANIEANSLPEASLRIVRFSVQGANVEINKNNDAGKKTNTSPVQKKNYSESNEVKKKRRQNEIEQVEDHSSRLLSKLASLAVPSVAIISFFFIVLVVLKLTGVFDFIAWYYSVVSP